MQDTCLWRSLFSSNHAEVGCGRRSILAEAVLASLVATCLTTLNVEIESASVGPAFGGGHDQRILEVCCAQFSAPLSDAVTSRDGLYW